MEAICISDYTQRKEAIEQADKDIEAFGQNSMVSRNSIMTETGYFDCYGIWFFSELADVIRRIAATKFNEELGSMMHVYLDVAPDKLEDSVYPVNVYGNDCLLYKWKARGCNRGLVVLRDDRAGNIAAKIYQASGTWSWVLDDEVMARLPVTV